MCAVFNLPVVDRGVDVYAYGCTVTSELRGQGPVLHKSVSQQCTTQSVPKQIMYDHKNVYI